jgi:hypothetical protein
MEDEKNQKRGEKISEEFLFSHLVVMFQTLALQQLGKLTSPISGKLERDLHQAKITIDMLEMIRNKMKNNLNEREEELLNRSLMQLQMNFVDESQREDQAPEEEEEKGEGEKEEEEGVEEETKAAKKEEKGNRGKGKKGGKKDRKEQEADKGEAGEEKGKKNDDNGQ